MVQCHNVSFKTPFKVDAEIDYMYVPKIDAFIVYQLCCLGSGAIDYRVCPTSRRLGVRIQATTDLSR